MVGSSAAATSSSVDAARGQHAAEQFRQAVPLADGGGEVGARGHRAATASAARAPIGGCRGSGSGPPPPASVVSTCVRWTPLSSPLDTRARFDPMESEPAHLNPCFVASLLDEPVSTSSANALAGPP